MKLSLCIAVGLLFAASTAFAGVGIGTIETGGGVDLHLSPEPWSVDAQAHVIYYFMPMLGVGPYMALYKEGEVDDVSYPTVYGIGALGKLYFPMSYKDGKLMPFVMAGFGIATLVGDYDPIDEEWTTENKGHFMMRVGFDYWLTENWTVWTGYQGEKMFVDGYDWQSSVKLGISTFITK
jgi:hypothetical protein